MKNEQIQEIEILKKYNQSHIVEHMEKLNNKDREKIVKQIEEIDFEELTSLYNKTLKQREKRKAQIKPIRTIIASEIEQEQKNEYIQLGEKVLGENKYAVVTMAGGQGTRLRA